MIRPCSKLRLVTSSNVVNQSFGPRSLAMRTHIAVSLLTRCVVSWLYHIFYAVVNFIHQVIVTAVPECTDPDDVSTAIEAFQSANLQKELIELLDRIVMGLSPFGDDTDLQNLLLQTTIRVDKGKVIGYINKLRNFNAIEIAEFTLDHGLLEEAFSIYDKDSQYALAANVLIENIGSLDRSLDYAVKIDRSEVWSRLAREQLDSMRVDESIGEYCLVCHN
jgi:clathrin heavy chain